MEEIKENIEKKIDKSENNNSEADILKKFDSEINKLDKNELVDLRSKLEELKNYYSKDTSDDEGTDDPQKVLKRSFVKTR